MELKPEEREHNVDEESSNLDYLGNPNEGEDISRDDGGSNRRKGREWEK